MAEQDDNPSPSEDAGARVVAGALRGDAGAVAQLDRGVASARDRGDYAAVDEALAPLVAAASAGEAGALDLLLRMVDRHRLAQAPVRKLLIDEQDAEEAVQNTLVSVARAIGSFEGRSRFTTWLYRIAEREALQVLRRNSRVTAPEGDDLANLTEEVRRMSSVIASQAMIRQALEELDPRFREAVVLCDVEGLDYATIAERLDIPLNTVRTRIRRGRQYVADRITEAMRSGGSLG